MKYLFLDIETTGLDWKRDQIHGVGFTHEEDSSEYIPATQVWAHDLAFWLKDPEIVKVGHNLRFDLRFLHRMGLKLAGPIFDTMLIAQLLNENQPLGLKALAEKYLGKEFLDEKAELDRAMSAAGVKHVGDLCGLDLEKPGTYYNIIARYCREDVENTLKLFHVFRELLQKQAEEWRTKRGAKKTPLDYLREEALPVEPVLLSLEVKGLKLNPAAIEETAKLVEEKHARLEEDIRTTFAEEIVPIEEQLYAKELEKRKTEAGKAKVLRVSEKYGTRFSLDSAAHVGRLIYEGLRAPRACRTRGGSWSTAEADLSALKQETPKESRLAAFLDAFAKYREGGKLISTYVSPASSLLKDALDGRVYSYYLQAGSSKDGGKGGTATGRLSSQAPNMQNLPRGPLVKRFFVPDPGHVFAYFDYSQVELRIAAHLSQDQELINAYRRGDDLHAITARGVFGRQAITPEERQVGKTLNFALIYDAKAYRLWQMLGPLGYSIEDCEEMRRAFFKTYAGYKQYLKAQIVAMNATRCVVAETGRVRRLPDLEYGEYLNWQQRSFNSPKGAQPPAVLVQALKQYPTEKLTENEAFQRAKKKFNHAQKQGFNFPIQSLGASITKRAMVKLHNLGYNIVTQVHDSIVIQLPLTSLDEMQKIKQVLESTYTLSVPLIAEGKLINSLDEGDKYK